MQIPTFCEQLILEGRAEFRTACQVSGRIVIEKPKAGYLILFGFKRESFAGDDQAPVMTSIIISDKKRNLYYTDSIYGDVSNAAQIPASEWPAYMVCDGDIYINVVTAESITQFTASNDPLFNNVPFRNMPKAAQDYEPLLPPASFIVSLEQISNLSGLAHEYYPLGFDISLNYYGVTSDVGYSQFFLSVNNAEGRTTWAQRYYRAAGDTMNLARVPAYNFFYLVVNEPYPAKSKNGFVINKN